MAADITVLRSDETRPLAHVGPVLAVALLATLVLQLVARRDGRDGADRLAHGQRVRLVLAGLAAAWLALDVQRTGSAWSSSRPWR